MDTIQMVDWVFPVVPRWNGHAAIVYVASWVSVLVSGWCLAGWFIGGIFLRGQGFEGARAEVCRVGAGDRKACFWGIIVTTGLAGALSLAAIEPGVWSGTYERVDVTLITLRNFMLLIGVGLVGWIWAYAPVGRTGGMQPQAGGQAGNQAGQGSADVGVLLFSAAGVLIGLDKLTGLAVGAGDGSTGGVAEFIMWCMWGVSLTSAGLAGIVSGGEASGRLARVGLYSGLLALFFGAVAATIRTGAGVSQVMMLAMTSAVFFGMLILLVLLMAQLARAHKARGLGRAAAWLALVMAGVVACVGGLGRTDLGASRLTGRGQVINKTVDPLQIASEVALDYDTRELEIGKAVFVRSCAQCHGIDFRVVGPPVTEIAAGYMTDPGSMALWIKNPGKKRDEYPQMARVVLTEDRYLAVSKFVVALARTAALKSETKSQEGKK